MTEIIDVLDPTKTCTLDSTADYPVATDWMPAGGVINGKAVACGGNSKDCYVFENRYQSWFAEKLIYQQVHNSPVDL